MGVVVGLGVCVCVCCACLIDCIARLLACLLARSFPVWWGDVQKPTSVNAASIGAWLTSSGGGVPLIGGFP